MVNSTSIPSDNITSPVRQGVPVVLAMSVFFVGATEFMLSSMLRPLAEAFDTSTANASWLIASYAITYAIAAPVFGYISDRVDRVRLLLIALFAFSIDGAAIAFAPSFEIAVGVRVFGGLASAVIIPTTFALIAEIFPRKHQAAAMGAIMLGMTLGIALGPAIAGLLTEAIGWRAPFIVTSFGCILALVIGFRILPHTEKKVPIPKKMKTIWHHKWAVWRPLISKGAWNGTGVAAFLLSGEVLQHRYDFGTAEIGITVTVFGIGLGIGNLGAGWLRRFCQHEEVLLVIVTVLLSASIATFMLASLPLIGSLACLTLWGAALGAGAPLSTVILAERSGNDKGVVLAFAETMNNIVIFAILPTASLALTEQGSNGAFIILAIGFGVGLLLTLLDVVCIEKRTAG